MRCPPPGLCLPVVVEQVRDGDTIVVRLPASSYKWAIRLLDCWAPELCTPAGKRAKAFVEQTLAAHIFVNVWIPAPQEVEQLLKNVTFDRLLGHIFVTHEMTLSELLVLNGHASREKPK